jgi:hypothetical protein
MVDNDFLIGMQTDPNIVGQLIAWEMLKQTEDWPPRSLHDMVVMANKLNYVLGKITPSIPVYELVQEDVDGQEEADEEEGY